MQKEVDVLMTYPAFHFCNPENIGQEKVSLITKHYRSATNVPIRTEFRRAEFPANL